MATTARDHNKIQLIFRGRLEEAPNDGSTLQPGMLAQLTSAGRIKPHSLEGGPGECLIVDVDLKAGMTVDDTYDGAQDTEVIPHLIPLEGDVLAVRLADGESVTKGVSRLSSNGDGTMKVAASGDQVMFVAWETMVADEAANEVLCKARRVSTFYNATDDSE